MNWLQHLRFSGVPGKMTRRLASVVLGGLAMTLFFGGLVARQLELAGGGSVGRANSLLIGGTVLALLAVAAAGGLRRGWGLSLGWIVLLLSAASTALLVPMGIVTVIFGALWLLALVQGPSMEGMTRDWIAEHGNVHPDDRATPHPDRAHGVAENHPTERTAGQHDDATERTEREDDN